MANFNSEHKSILGEMVLIHPQVREVKMFGYPAYYVGKKLCICLYEQGIGVKVPENIAENLLNSDSNVVLFQPLG
ncbi:MAG: hypothetical protein A2Y88_09655 [Chloroflexi bacterium RBG_13_48_10]|nr:MAG: hypothetical protein A2Y88_09655 [Chloroflexi bacterium RBG_13_48_10]